MTKEGHETHAHTHVTKDKQPLLYCYETINHFKSFRCCLMRRYVFWNEKLVSSGSCQSNFHANAHYSSKEMKKKFRNFWQLVQYNGPFSFMPLNVICERHVQSRKTHFRTNTSLINHKNLHFFRFNIGIFQRGIRNALKCLSEIKNKHLCDIVKQWKCVVLLLLAWKSTFTTTRGL